MFPISRSTLAPTRIGSGLLVLLLSGIGPARAHAAADGTWIPLDPPPRQSFSLVLDGARNRLVLFGGFEGGHGLYNDVRSLALATPSAWQAERPLGSPPSPRYTQATAYDSRRGRMLVFGGFNGPDLNDVWSLDLSGDMSWQQLMPAGVPPPAREFSSAVYDSLRDRLLLFGGVLNDGTGLNDVWELSLSGAPAWTQLNPSGPPPAPRAGAAIVVDPVRDRMIVFGGGQPILDGDQQTWALNLSGSPSWTRIMTSGGPPQGLYGTSGIYDPIGDRFVTISGLYESTPMALGLGDSNPTWTSLLSPYAPGPHPPGRYQNGAVYDAVGHALVICGGYVNNSLDDTWSFSLDNPAWTKLAPLGQSLPIRASHSAVIDEVANQVIVFGGMNPFDVSDLWTRDLSGPAGWSPIQPQNPAPAYNRDLAAAYDTKRRRILYFGGQGTFQGITNTVSALDLNGVPTWSTLATVGTPPSPRAGSTAIYDPQGDRLIVFAGLEAYSYVMNDVWSLSLSGVPTWTQWTPGPGPGGRAWGSAAYDAARNRMVVFGGFYYGNPGVYNDVWALSLDAFPSWTLLNAGNTGPLGRFNAEAVVDRARDRLVIHGGGLADVWALSLAGAPQWTQLAPAPPGPDARRGAQAVYDVIGDRMLVIGGQNNNYTYEGDTWSLAFGAVTRPAIACPEPVMATPGAMLAFDYPLTNRLGSAADYAWKISCDREWPGLPDSGVVHLGGGATDNVHVTVSIPDTVTNGNAFLGFVAHLEGVPMLAETCSVRLRGASTAAMGFTLTPNTLSLASHGRWVTGFLEPAAPLSASEIDVFSIRLNATVAVDPLAPTALGDHDGNGVPDLMVKFDRAAVEFILSAGEQVSVGVTGTVNGHAFAGSALLRVIRPVMSAPASGSHLTAGSVAQVRWEVPSGFTAEPVTLLSSFDGGSTWSPIAQGRPNSGSYDWIVPNVEIDQAKVAVVLAESADATAPIVDAVVGMSEVFSIDALVSVGDGRPAQFALGGVMPNPARRELRVRFSLRDSKPATLVLYDVSGRQVSSLRVEAMGPGWHTVTLGGRTSLPAGVYVIRLTQEGGSLTTRATIVP